MMLRKTPHNPLNPPLEKGENFLPAFDKEARKDLGTLFHTAKSISAFQCSGFVFPNIPLFQYSNIPFVCFY